MMTVNRKSNCQREQAGAAKKCPQQDLPVLESLFPKNPQSDAGAKESQDVLEVQRIFNLCCLILSKKGLNTLIVELGGIDVLHNIPISRV